MSAVQTWTLHCDASDCDQKLAYGLNLSEARRAAREQHGWILRSGSVSARRKVGIDYRDGINPVAEMYSCRLVTAWVVLERPVEATP